MTKLALVIGQGEVGAPLYEMLVDAFGHKEVFFRDVAEPGWTHKFRFLHICYPQTVNWFESILRYVEQYGEDEFGVDLPEAVIIHSTVHPGTTTALNKVKPIFFYSPVRGNIKDGMRWCLENYTKYLAGRSIYVDKFIPRRIQAEVRGHLEKANFKVKTVNHVEALEYAKILDLAWYGLNIAFYQELERICELGPLQQYKVVREFIESTEEESRGKVQRAVFYGGHIGGHCVIPAIEKVLALHDIPMLKAVVESNIKRERELTLEPGRLLGLPRKGPRDPPI